MPEKRLNPIRDPEIIAGEQTAYTDKIEKNRDNGLKTLASGEYPLFTGWSIEKQSGRTFDTILLLDKPSQTLARERVIDPLYQLAKRFEIPAAFPEFEDGPLHVVLQPGRFTNLNPEQMETIKKYLASNKSHLNMLARALEGLTFHHDTLVVTVPTTYICAGEFDTAQGGIFKARDIMDQIIAHALRNLKSADQQVQGTFTPNDYHDICHSSVMRFVQKRATPEHLIAFAQEAYATVGENLRRDPLPVKIAGLYRGMAVDYQRQAAPQFVLP